MEEEKIVTHHYCLAFPFSFHVVSLVFMLTNHFFNNNAVTGFSAIFKLANISPSGWGFYDLPLIEYDLKFDFDRMLMELCAL